jgi:hypothetical protein
MADPIRMACQFKKPSDRDLTHKAYEIRCIPPPNLPRINFEHHWVNDIPIHDIRDIQGQLSLDVQGFIVGVLPSQMPYEDFFEQKKLQAGYAEQLREYLLEILGAQCVYFHECVVSASLDAEFCRSSLLTMIRFVKLAKWERNNPRVDSVSL